MWKIEDEKLLNKMEAFKTEDTWTFICEGQMVYIENKTKNEVIDLSSSVVIPFCEKSKFEPSIFNLQYLTVTEDGKAKMVDLRDVNHLWNKGTPDQDGWYTLTWGPTNQILTFNNPAIYEPEGSIDIEDNEEFTLTSKFISFYLYKLSTSHHHFSKAWSIQPLGVLAIFLKVILDFKI